MLVLTWQCLGSQLLWWRELVLTSTSGDQRHQSHQACQQKDSRTQHGGSREGDEQGRVGGWDECSCE